MNRGISTARSIILLLLLSMGPVFPVAPNAAAGNAPVDFAPGDATRLFAIPETMWSNINQFAFLVCLDEPGVAATLNDRLSKLQGYPALRSSCQVWGEMTFPTLQELAAQLATGDLKLLLVRLQGALLNLSNNVSGARAEFDQVADRINKRLLALTNLSRELNEQSMSFHNASGIVISQYQKNNPPDSAWVNIGPKLEDVGTALGSMVGRWNTLTANLAYLRKTVALPPGTVDVPQLYDLDIEVGLNAWDEIARRAQQFIGNAPAQNKYLSGQNYYEHCAVDENKWYFMTNLFLSDRGFVLTAQRSAPISEPPQHTAQTYMKLRQQQPEIDRGDRDNYNQSWSQQWRFQRVGKGWLNIESRIRNDTGNPFMFLLGSDGLVDRVMRQPSESAPRKYWWRCLETDRPPRFRLANATLGDMKLLDTANDEAASYPSMMGDTQANFSGQFWKLEPAANP